jgi:hypothetical protein
MNPDLPAPINGLPNRILSTFFFIVMLVGVSLYLAPALS